MEANDTLDDLLNDPMVKLVMARDGWRGEDVRRLLVRVQARSDDNVDIPPAHVIDSCCQRLGACI